MSKLAPEWMAWVRNRWPRMTLERFWYELEEWSQATFGTDLERGPVGPLKHLAKEVEEAITQPHDVEEYADCVFLVFDAARRAGFTYDALVEAIDKKLEKNRKRQWGKPTGDEPIEHIRD